MKRALFVTILLSGVASAQPPAPKFAFADVHVSAKVPNPFVQVFPPKNGRYEIHNASMVDLIHIAWNVDADKVVGGPNWLEMDRFDLVAKVPEDATVDTSAPAFNQNASTPNVLRPMLQSLLADRFKLTAHTETKQMPAWVLIAGKSPHLKEADGSGDTGCKMQSQPGSDGPSLGLNGTPIRLGPDMSVLYACRNMTMDSFAAMISGGNLGPNPVQNKTGLDGKYNFDVKWSMQIALAFALPGDNGSRITIPEAVDKQLGLKLEQQSIPMTVVVVDSVNEKAAPNPPGTEEALALPPAPKTFEVADVKPSDPASNDVSMRAEPSGRFTAHSQTLRAMILRAFAGNNLLPNADSLVDIPKFADDKRFDIIAKGTPDAAGTFNLTTMAPMLHSLLEERFGMKTHTEERPLSAYTLVAVKPKMKKADPASRTHCIATNNPQGSPAGTVILNCQNITMAQLALQLQNQGQGLNWPLLDSTGLEGGWDFTLTWNRRAGLPALAGRGGEAGPAANGAAVADDPSGGYTIFEAIEKELGLKLDAQKRPEPVIVIDHLEDHPTDN
jgi:uncharacterized protein (TIGR03435 family)